METIAIDRVPAPLAFSGALDDRRGDEMLHRGLFMCNRRRMRPGTVSEVTPAFREALRELATIQFFENHIVEIAGRAVGEHAAEAPSSARQLLLWLERLRDAGPGQLDPLWEWLATRASQAELEWFLLQELVAETGTALLAAEVCRPSPALPALERLRHTAMSLGVTAPEIAHATARVTWEALGRSNLVTALANNNRWQTYAVGAFASMMMVLPVRVAFMERAARRLGHRVFVGVPSFDRELVAHLVTRHLELEPGSGRELACGALMWMRAGVRCLDSYRGRLALKEHAA